MKSQAIRQAFLNYFREQGHSVVPSSSLVPENDPTLLFTNAGMVQFKDTFLGQEQRPYVRATSSQRCVRAGGKHNDLENVGYTARHHTFFEMLGNFSFGDYFKREAIQFAWVFLTKVLKFPAEKLWVTVFRDDDEAAAIWLDELKIDPSRFSRCDEADNFWSMGDTGPCGPCSEIFYDHGPQIAGGPPGSAEADGDRYIEIWNLVFMQYNRDTSGKLTPLPKPSVDTGMGLERLTAILQGVHNNFETDLFVPLLTQAAKLAGVSDIQQTSLRVIADHIRASSFLITDGVLPSNEGRGYVLRRIIRRACRHGHQLGLESPFFYQLVPTLVDIMGAAYPELQHAQTQIMTALEAEERQFNQTLATGMQHLTQAIAQAKGNVLTGEVVFRLYDTYGFPADLTADIAREHDCRIDEAGFQQALAQQQQQSRAASQFKADYHARIASQNHTEFVGYEVMQQSTHIAEIFVAGEAVNQLQSGEQAVIVLEKTPFYAQGGGQVGDVGQLLSQSGDVFTVMDTQKKQQAILHIGQLQSGKLQVGQALVAQVHAEERLDTMRHHSATHLLHAALRQLLGEHVEQKGSLVDSKRLRFDFTHPQPLDDRQIGQLEALVNLQIRENNSVTTELMDIEAAKQSGAMALFGEKYSEQVRVLSMGAFSKELCGGTHVSRTGDIGLFKIIQDSGIAAGIRRIEALAGKPAFDYIQEQNQILKQMGQQLKTHSDQLLPKLSQLLSQQKHLEKQVVQLQKQLASGQSLDLSSQAKDVVGIKVLAHRFDDIAVSALRNTLDQLKNKLGSCMIVLASKQGEKVHLVAGVSKDCVEKISAPELVNHIAKTIGGKGGGRADMAQAGGQYSQELDNALVHLHSWVGQQLNA